MKRLAAGINGPGVLVALLVVLVWQLTALGPFAAISSFASPIEAVGGFLDWYADGDLLGDLGHTLGVVVVSSAIALIAGTTIGLLIGLVWWFDVFTTSSFDVLRTIPLVALMPVALLIWGAEARTEIIVSSIAAMWPMLVNAAAGVRDVHPRLLEVGRMFQFSRRRTIMRLVLPAAVPQLVVGARLSIITALIAAIVAEMLIAPAGLGWKLIETQHALRTDQTWAVMLTCAVVGLLLNVILAAAVRRVHADGLRDAG